MDALAGTRYNAFNSSALAGALEAKLGKKVDADNLPFSWIDIAPDGTRVRFRADDTVYEWKNGQLNPTKESLHEVSLSPIRAAHQS